MRTEETDGREANLYLYRILQGTGRTRRRLGVRIGGTPMKEHKDEAISRAAAYFGWDKYSTKELGLLLWGLFRYYTRRVGEEMK